MRLMTDEVLVFRQGSLESRTATEDLARSQHGLRQWWIRKLTEPWPPTPSRGFMGLSLGKQRINPH